MFRGGTLAAQSSEDFYRNSKMAALVEERVYIKGDDMDPKSEDNHQKDSAGGSESERSLDEDGNGGGGGCEEKNGNDLNISAGWAEAMARILARKTSDRKSSILLKNKELVKIKEKERQEQLERKKQVDKKRAWEMICREKPDIVKDREIERALQRIATRGVVQLFNAVREHQKEIDNKVRRVCGSERKKAKVLSSVSKKDFIQVLRRTEDTSRVAKRTEKNASAAEERPAWSVFRDDFMMGATMKDWDKGSGGEEADCQLAGEQ